MQRIPALAVTGVVLVLFACGGRVAPLPDGPDANVGPIPPGPPGPPNPPTIPAAPEEPDGGRVLDAGEGIDGGRTGPTYADAGPPRTQPDAGLACFDRSMGVSTWIWTGPAAIHQNICTAAQIADLYAACYGPSSNQADCYFFMDKPANLSCERCVIGYGMFDDNSDQRPLPQPVLLPAAAAAGNGHVSLNTKACAAASLGLPECGKPVTDIAACTSQACLSCNATEFGSCLSQAASGPCQRIVTDNDASCFAPIEAGKSSWSAACGADETSFAHAYTVLANTMCGQ